MTKSARRMLVTAALALLVASAGPASAEITAEHRRELAEIRDSLSDLASQIRRKEFDAAGKLIDEARQRLDEVQKDAAVEDDDRTLLPVRRLIENHQSRLAAARGVSLTDHILPILKDNCTECHGGQNPRAGLSLESFEGLQKGGQSGPLLAVGNPRRSRILFKLLAPDNQKMPPGNRPRLSAQDIQAISQWIAQGAKDDSKDSDGRPKTSVEILYATGDEKVSFTRDIAPWMVNLCLGCHSGNNPRGELSLETFEKLMEGGQSGQVIIPGEREFREYSRLFRLVGGLENPRMPQGQGRLTRQNYEELVTWFEEGNRYDGKDPKTPLRQLVPTPEQLAAERFAKMTPDEFARLRLERSESMWRRAQPKEQVTRVEGDQVLVFGNGGESRLREVAGWADEHAVTLRKMFSEKDELLWRGKLAVHVVRGRFGYQEFNIVIERREPPREMTGHSVVTDGMEDAYVVLEDIGDAPDDGGPSLKINLIDHMTGAYLKRGGGSLPDWVVRGAGLALAAQSDASNPHFPRLRQAAPEALRTVQRPEDIFADGTFSPSAIGPVGYTLVDYLLKSGGSPKFGQLIRALQAGQGVAEALRAVYRTDVRNLGTAYVGSVGKR